MLEAHRRLCASLQAGGQQAPDLVMVGRRGHGAEEILSELESELKTKYFDSLGGRRLRVLVEGNSPHEDGRVVGTSCRYAPVELAGGTHLIGNFSDVIAGRQQHGYLTGDRPALANC